MIFTTAINTNTTTIEQLQAQIEQLQEQLAEVQKHQQALQSLDGAAETAVAQVANVVKMARRIAPDELAAFKDAIDWQFEDGAIAELTEADAPEEEAQPEPEPTPPSDDTAIDVEVDDVPPEISPEAHAAIEEIQAVAESHVETNGKVPAVSTVGAQQRSLRDMTLAEIKKECTETLGLTLERVKEFGILTRRNTWEAAYKAHRQ